MKTLRFAFILLILSTLSTLSSFISMAQAQTGAVAPPSEFAQLMSRAAIYEKQNQANSTARGYYVQAVQKAQNDDERAQAQLGIARNTEIQPPNSAPDDAGVAKNAEYSKVSNFPEAPASRKAEALLGMARVQSTIKRYDSASNLLAMVLQMPDALPEQKLQAALWQGEVLIDLKQYDNARSILADYLKVEGLDLDQKNAAYRRMAHSYLAQENTMAARAELAKTVVFPDLKDEKIADMHIANGDFLKAESFNAAARDEYDKVAILADASPGKNVVAKFRAGEAYFAEKNYAAAREAWTLLLGMRGAEASTAELKKVIGLTYYREGNYAAAREAYNQWLAVNGLDLAGKVEAWQSIADTYTEEKNYVAAREALGNIGQGAQPGSGLHLRQQFAIAEVYRVEQDFDNARAIYIGVLNAIASLQKASDHYTAQDMIEVAAAGMAKEPAAMAAAYALFEALEKHHPYEKEDAEANLGMGDILLAQGKREEARAKYQKALDLRKNYDEGKLAQKKLDEMN